MKSFQLRPLVRTTVSLPPGLHRFALRQARLLHSKNVSAYVRALLHRAWMNDRYFAPAKHHANVK